MTPFLSAQAAGRALAPPCQRIQYTPVVARAEGTAGRETANAGERLTSNDRFAGG